MVGTGGGGILGLTIGWKKKKEGELYQAAFGYGGQNMFQQQDISHGDMKTSLIFSRGSQLGRFLFLFLFLVWHEFGIGKEVWRRREHMGRASGAIQIN